MLRGKKYNFSDEGEYNLRKLKETARDFEVLMEFHKKAKTTDSMTIIVQVGKKIVTF